MERILVERGVFTEGAHVELLHAGDHVAAGQIDVAGGEGGTHVGGGELAGVEAVAFEVDAALAVHAAPDIDATDAGNLFEAFGDFAFENEGPLLQIPSRRGDDDENDGNVVGIEFPNPGGGSISGGRSSRMGSMAARRSLVASSRLVSRVTRDSPSSEREATRSTPGTPATAFSTWRVMISSISWGPTPG